MMFIMWKIDRGDLGLQIANVADTYQDRFGAFPTAIYAHAADIARLESIDRAAYAISTPPKKLGTVQPGTLWIGIAPQAVRA